MTTNGLKKLVTIAALTFLLALVGVLDHHLKSTRMHRADVAWWYCAHRSVGCGSNPESLEHRAQRIEHAWQVRERLYTLLLGMLLGAGFVTLIGMRTPGVPALTQPSRN